MHSKKLLFMFGLHIVNIHKHKYKALNHINAQICRIIILPSYLVWIDGLLHISTMRFIITLSTLNKDDYVSIWKISSLTNGTGIKHAHLRTKTQVENVCWCKNACMHLNLLSCLVVVCLCVATRPRVRTKRKALSWGIACFITPNGLFCSLVYE